MKKKLLAGLMAATIALGGCQAPGEDVLPPEDSVKEEATDVTSEAENIDQAGPAGAEPASAASDSGEAAAGAKPASASSDSGEAAAGAEPASSSSDSGEAAAGAEPASAASDGKEGDLSAEDSNQPASDAAEVASETGDASLEAGALEEAAGRNPEVRDLEKQIAVIVAGSEEWIHFYEVDDPYRCMAVTDLDGNGRLEITVAAHWITGAATYFDMWEVNEDLSALKHVDNDFAEDASVPDILDYSAYDFYTDEDGRHYLAYAYQNTGSNESEQELMEVTLKEGQLTHQSLGKLRTFYGDENTETGTGPDGEAISTADFWNLSSKLLENETGDRSVWISWLMLPREGESAWNEEGILIRAQGSWHNFLVGSDVLSVMFEGVYDGDEDTVIMNPGEGPLYAGDEPAVSPLPLDILSEEGNEITDTDAWFDRNSLEKPAEALNSARWQAALNKNAGTVELLKDGSYDCLMDLNSFTSLPEESGVCSLRYTAVDGDVIYVSVSRKPYSDQDYGTGFIIAIDLNEKALIWKSEALVSGSYNFVVRDGRIFTGYGATGEDDFLYQIDQATGRTLGSVKLTTAPDYILAVDDVLYVRTYNTDYTFSLAG